MKTKFQLKIPKEVIFYYCTKSNLILLKSHDKRKIIKLDVKLVYLKKTKVLIITDILTSRLLKKKKSVQGSAFSLIKKSFLELTVQLCKKLKLVGVGYRASIIDEKKTQLLHLKLGYSHSIYYKVPSKIKIYVHKSNKLFIFGNSFELISKVGAFIRNYKILELYKGKGILYDNEIINLKEGKTT
jgi:large subunit ribosomal protein L6